ncbi:hypothetical protein BGZ50_007510 [Haplosporangium sp. Z 11]|nr:hypothetical protein BGZ50_007510 [Haplosporangium sp. Z 11]
MSGITFNCLTTDTSTTTYYGMALADDYAISKYPSTKTKVIAMVKSNTSPASPQSLTWSVVSKIRFESLTGQNMRPYDLAMCAINSKGVFSLMVHYGFPSSGSSKPETWPTGPRLYQYDPNGKKMDASFNYDGTGSWSNVTIDTSDLSITGSWLHPRLKYVNNGGIETLILSYADDNLNVGLAVLNEATNTFAYAATWKMNDTLYGRYTEDAVIDGNYLYRIAEGSSPDHPLPYVSSFPISSTIPATPPEGRLIDASAFAGINWQNSDLRLDLAASAGTLYVLAVGGSYTKKDWDSVLISQTPFVGGAATLGKAVNVSQRFFYNQYFVPINDGQFALMKSGDQMDAITLSGSSFGNFYANISINIADSIDPNFKFEVAKPNGRPKVGLIVGVIAAAVVLVGAGIGYFLWRKKFKRHATGAAGAVTAAPALPSKDHAYNQGNTFFQKMELETEVGHDGRPIAYDQTATHPGFIGATVTPLTTATTTMSGPPVQTFQGHMQDLQFSSHPRPNFVTGGPSMDGQSQYGGAHSGFSGTAAASQAPWQPTPFIPPTESQSNFPSSTSPPPPIPHGSRPGP